MPTSSFLGKLLDEKPFERLEMATLTFALPLCEHEITIADDDYREWHLCSCGRYYSRKTLNAYKQALDALYAADEQAEKIEHQAKREDHARRSELSVEDGQTSDAVLVEAPNANIATAAWNAENTATAVSAGLNRAPIKVQPERPRRALPKLSPQQTLLTVAASLLLIALSIFFGTTWNEPWFSLPLKAGVLALIVAATAFGSIRSKKYFVIISNFLAALSSGFLALGLYAAAALGLYGGNTSIADPSVSPYLAIVILVTGAYSTLMGRRFKVFGWLAATPVSMALAGLLSIQYFQQHQLWPNFDITIISLTVLLVFVVGRLTRLASPVEVESVKKSKKTPTSEESEEQRENKYQIDLFEREQSALSNIIRIAAGISMAMVALRILTTLPIDVLARRDGASSVGYFVLAVFWLAASVAIELRGANYIVSDSVPRWAKRVAWNLGFGILAGALLLVLRPATPGISWVVTIADAVVGAGLLFAVSSKVASKFEGSLAASQAATAAVWGLYVIIANFNGEFDSTLFATWLSIVAAALFAKAWVNKQRVFALLAAIAGNLAAVSLLVLQFSGNPSVLGSLAVSLALCTIWFVAMRVLDSRLQTEQGFGPWIYLAANVVLVLSVIIKWNSAQSDWSLLVVSAAVTGILVWLTTSKLTRANEKQPLLLNALLWAVSGFVLLAKGPYDTNHSVWSLYALAIFAIALFELAKSKAVSSMLAAIVSATFATILTARWSLDATVEAHLVNPAPFLVLAVVTSMLVHRVGKTSSRELNLAASASFVVSWGAFMAYKVQLTSGWTDSDASGNSIFAVVAFAILATALMLLRLREPAKKNLGVYFGVAGVTSLVGSLLAGASVGRVWTSLLLITFTLALAFVLSFITARANKSANWFWAAYALALSAIASTQATIVAAQSGAMLEVWLSVIVPISMALTLVLHTLMTSASRTAGAKFGWQTLPAVSVGAAILALLTPSLAGYYSASPIELTSTTTWTTTIGFSVLAALYLGLRLRGKASQAAQRALLSASAVSLVLALGYAVLSNQPDQQLQVASILGVYAVLLLAQAVIRRELRTNLYGSALLVASGWLFINKLTENATFVLTEFYSVTGAAVFLLSSRLMTRANQKFNQSTWRFALAAIFAAGTFIGLAQYSGSSFSQSWVEFLLSDVIAIAAFFGARTKFEQDATERRVSLWIVGVVSWIVTLIQAVGKTNTDGFTTQGALLRELILSVSVAATLLVMAQLDKRKAFFAAGAVTSTIAGAVAATFTLTYVTFEGPELFSVFIAVAWFVSALVGRQINAIPERLASLALIAAPLLAISVPSVVFSWATVAEPLASLSAGQLTRVLVLAVGGAALVVLGVRLGNLGLTAAGATPLALTLVPNLWFRIEDAFSGRTQLEIKSLFVGALLYGALRTIFAALKTSMKSIVYIGIPVVIAIGPAMLDALSALSQPTLTREDWLRFFIVLGGSLVLLVLGSLRKIGGLFVPGAVGVILSALPYAWAQISSQNWALWFVLILVATLLVMVAIRLEQFKTGAKSASNWMRELR